MSRGAICGALCLGLAGCAPAMKEPPGLHEMAGQRAAAVAADVAVLLSRADTLREERTIESVTRAAEDYLHAAAADPSRTEGLIGAVRAGVWLTNNLTDASARRYAAVNAVNAGQWCLRVDPDSASCAYWLAVALGVQARERSSTGYDALPRIVELLEVAAERDPLVDQAGPHRVLALVLLRAPGWPTGPGDPDWGLGEAQEAVRLRPDYPPNQLCLGEALRKTDNPGGSRLAYEQALALARSELNAGRPEAQDWLEAAETALETLDESKS